MDYTVNLWACKPGTQDLCITGRDTNTESEAWAMYDNARDYFAGEFFEHENELWVEIIGPDFEDEMCVYKRDKQALCDSDEEWRHEQAMEAGMLHGIDAYNEMMGY